jgi:hypothetical protein
MLPSLRPIDVLDITSNGFIAGWIAGSGMKYGGLYLLLFCKDLNTDGEI